MSGRWNLRAVSPSVAREKAVAVFKALAWFAMLKSRDPEKQKLLDRLHELRIEIQNIMDLLAPGWENE